MFKLFHVETVFPGFFFLNFPTTAVLRKRLKVGNHDNKRVASRFGQDMVDPINTLLMMLPGTAVTYNGEELGMDDGIIRWDQTVDPWGRAGGVEKYEVNSRDPFRTPFQWNDLQNGGKYDLRPEIYSYTRHTGRQIT